MEDVFLFVRFLHILSFVFMSVPLFNLIVVNERALMGSRFDYAIDRYMENIIRHGAMRCDVFQTSVLVTGILLMVWGPSGIEGLWQNVMLLAKTLLLVLLMSLLTYVHVRVQPRIEARLEALTPEAPVPEDMADQLKPYRVLRKRLATVCLFLVIVTIILGMQVYGTFSLVLNLVLIALAALFAWRANTTLIRFGWT